MQWMINSSLKFRFLLMIFSLAIIFFGLFQLRQMPIDILPEFSPPMVEIQTEALGLSAAEIEELVTMPLEVKLLNGVAWVESIYSESVPGLSSIVMMFEPGTNMLDARQMVQERLVSAQVLPRVSTPPAMLQPLSSLNRVMMIGLTSQEQSGIDMSVLARWNIRPKLMGIPGVANVAIWGQRKRQLQVQVDPEELRATGVSLEQVVRTTGNALWVSPLTFLEASTPGSGGFIDTPTQRLNIRHVQPIVTEKELARIPLEGHDHLTLGQIANVIEDHQPLIGDASINGNPGLILMIEKFPWADTASVTKEVEATMAAMQAGLPGISVNTDLFRPATYVAVAKNNLIKVGALTLLLITAGLLILQSNRRLALISMFTVTVSIFSATLIIYNFGVTLNFMVIAGLFIAYTIMIDDAVIGTEQLLRQRQENRSEMALHELILLATKQIQKPLMYASTIMIVALIPLYFFGGIAGAFFRPIAMAYGIGILTSLFVSLCLISILTYLMLRNVTQLKTVFSIIAPMKNAYRSLLISMINKPKSSIIISASLILLPVMFSPLLTTNLIPEIKEYDFQVRWESEPGVSRKSMVDIAEKASQEFKKIPGISNVSVQIGRAIYGDEVVGINSGQLWISIDPKANYRETVAAIKRITHQNPNLNRGVNTFINERINKILVDSPEDLVVRIYGDDFDTLNAKANQLQPLLSQVDGVSSADIEFRKTEPIIEIEVDLLASDKYGIKPGDVRRAAATMVQGIEVGNLFEEQKVFEVIVVGKSRFRNNIEDVKKMLIETPSGDFIRMDQVANIQLIDSLSTIKRDTISRRIDINLKINTFQRDSVIDNIQNALTTIDFPEEYYATVIASNVNSIILKDNTIAIIIACILAILLILQAAIGRWRLAFMAYLLLIMSLSGGVLGIVFSGGIINIGTLSGFIMILGISARHSILFIHNVQNKAKQDNVIFDTHFITDNACHYFCTKMTTYWVLLLGLLPMMWFSASPGFEIIGPMAFVIFMGLISTMIVHFLILPIWYLKMNMPFRSDIFELPRALG